MSSQNFSMPSGPTTSSQPKETRTAQPKSPPGLTVDEPYCGTVYGYVQVKHKFTCIFKEPLQAPFTGEGLLLTDLWRFVFSKHAVDETQGLVTSMVVILKTVQLGQKTLAVTAFNMGNKDYLHNFLKRQ